MDSSNKIGLTSVISPVEEILSALFQRFDLRLFIKRDDKLHPHISGNKWRKLKYNLRQARQLGHNRLLTFGGAYSNHLAATAAAGKEYGFSTLGVVRGEKVLPLNPTLKYVESCGMELRFVSRTNFRNKNQNSIFEDLKVNPNMYYVLPEGGSNCLALKGVAELVNEIIDQLGSPPDFLCTACGTGATMAGLVSGAKRKSKILGIPVLKGGFMESEVRQFLAACGEPLNKEWKIVDGYHFGGYAKYKPELIQFINHFKEKFGIPLDPIYTGKLVFALFDLAEKGFFRKKSTVVILHTGGLQGITGFNERHGQLIQ
ncbi:MAG: pyridoxal-phosphate dependent enzyme [Bacteroidota bacterium]